MIWLILAAAFLLPYSQVNAWNFIPATLVIALGLRTRPAWRALLAWRALAGFGVLGLVLAAAFQPVMGALAQAAGLAFDASRWSPWLRTRPVFQVLNEELVLRGLLLTVLAVRTRRHPALASAAVAAVFSGLHQALYPLKDGSWLGFGALLNLFLFGVWANAAFLRSRHIGWGLAVHLGWNLNRFTGDFVRAGQIVPEGQLFDPLEGSLWLTGPLLVLAVIETARLRRSE